MVSISTAPRSWRPEWMLENVPEFTWRVPTVIERELFEGSMAEHNALAAFPWAIDAQFRAGLEALLPDDPEKVENLADMRDRVSSGTSSLTAKEMALYDEAVEAVREYWPGYRQIIAQASRRESLLPTMAFRKFVTGWDGVTFKGEPVSFSRGIDGMVTDDALACVEPTIIRALGLKIYSAMYDRSAEKNSEPPLPSEGGRKNSKAKTLKVGKSARTPGRKIPD
ncbi:MAG: hypothetical protein J0H88_08395 [Sphingomonadales bacterium]|nr:hypothetical protein [Sphingomonadales bacterium]